MTDSDNPPVEGELVGPEGDGSWQSATTAHVALGIGSKTLYRRIERGQIPSRKNDLGRIEVWVPAPVEHATQQLATTGGVSVSDTKEIVTALVAALTTAQRQSEERLERAIRAELRLAELEQQARREQSRPDDSHP